MLERTDFVKKQIVFYYPADGDKMSFKNDNMIITEKDGKTKLQVTCYRVFLVFVAGDTTITTGLLNRSAKFGFSICLMNRNLKIYKYIGSRMEGNTYLRRIQYSYDGQQLAQRIVWNKIRNQRRALASTRQNNEWAKEALCKLDTYLVQLEENEFDKTSYIIINLCKPGVLIKE